jgi:hypothetical protein
MVVPRTSGGTAYPEGPVQRTAADAMVRDRVTEWLGGHVEAVESSCVLRYDNTGRVRRESGITHGATAVVA